jgi:hypothetical protein
VSYPGIQSRFSKTYAGTGGADINLDTASQQTSGNPPQVTRQGPGGIYIACGSAGNLVVQYANGSTDTIPVTSGYVTPPSQISKIKAATTVNPFTVHFG